MNRFAAVLSPLLVLASPVLAQTAPISPNTPGSSDTPASPDTKNNTAAPPSVNIAPPADATPPAIDKSGFTFLNPTPASALRFSTDRPTKSNSPITVDAGHVQYETDLFNYQHSNAGGVSTRIYTFADPVVKLGLTNRVDLEVQFTGYNIEDVNTPGSNAHILHAAGAGDVYLRTKVNLFGNESGPALALIPYVKFPTAARNIGNGHTEGGIIAPFTYPLPLDFLLLIEPEVDILKNAADAGHHFTYTQLLNISHPIGKKTTVYGEIYSQLGADSRSPAIYTFDTAVSYLITDSLQVDAGANIGLNRASPNLQLYTGIAQRF